MAEQSGRHDPVWYYGHLAWIAGMALGGGIMYIMFAFADGFG